MSFDDRYNNFKIVEQEVKRTVTSTSNSGSQNMAFVTTPRSTNEVNTANVQVSTANSTISTDSTLVSTANLSDAIVYAFLANQPNGSQLVHKDLEQIHKDDLEEMDLKWQLALLSMRARKYYQKTGKKITINGSDTAGQRNQESRARNQDNSKRTVNVEDISSKAMVAIDGAAFDWSYMADEEVPTNLALIAFSDPEIEKLKNEKESNQIKIDNFENASKSLDKLIGSQISKNNRKGVGYNAVPPPPTGLFAPPTIDLSNSSLKEFQQPKFEGYGFKANKGVLMVLKSDNVQHKPEQANQPKKVSQNLRNNRTKWNEIKTQKLGVGFQTIKKACFVCGSFNHLIKDCDFHDKKMVQKPVLNNVKKETAVLTKSGIVPVSAARPINTVAPKSFVNAAKTRPNAFQKSHSLSRRPFYQQTSLKNRNLNDKVNTAKGNRVTSAVGEQGINVVKSSACWVWRPKIKTQVSLELKGYLINNGYADLVKMLYDKKELAIPGQTATGVHIPLFDTMLIHDQPGQGEGPTLTLESQHTPIASPSTSQPTTSQPMSSQEQPSQVPITEPITDSFTTSHPTQTPSPMPHDSPLSGGHTPGSDEGSKKLNELTKLCTKLSDKVTSLEEDLKQTKKIYGKALTKLVKKVKQLEAKLKSTTERRKARMVISDDEEDPTDDELQRRSIIEEIDLAKILEDASRKRVKTYTRRRSTNSSRDSTVGGLFSTAEEVQGKEHINTDEKVAQKLNDKEMARAAAREEQERIDFEKALELQKQLDEREETDNIDWNTIVEQVQERQSDTIKRYQTLKKKPVSVAQARKNMMIYLKNMVGYKMCYFKGMSYDEIRPIFEEEYNKIQTLFKKDTEVEKINTKRIAEETLLHESFKKLRTTEASRSEPIQEQPTKEPKELSEGELIDSPSRRN
ncbi:hypothetical protein Tco_0510718 [Tanacetum coccineum]